MRVFRPHPLSTALTVYIDEISTAGYIRGWAWDIANPELPVLLEIFVRGQLIGTVLACDHRTDLKAAGYGQGNCGFSFVSRIGLPRDLENNVQLRRVADAMPLVMANTSPLVLVSTNGRTFYKKL